VGYGVVGMKKIYWGDCEELYGQEIEIEDHDCRDHAVWEEHSYTETHGLDCGPYETWTEDYYKCSVCGERIDE
jgi:hypothetical protein